MYPLKKKKKISLLIYKKIFLFLNRIDRETAQLSKHSFQPIIKQEKKNKVLGPFSLPVADITTS